MWPCSHDWHFFSHECHVLYAAKSTHEHPLDFLSQLHSCKPYCTFHKPKTCLWCEHLLCVLSYVFSDPNMLSLNSHELPIGCWRRTCIKSTCNWLLSWDLMTSKPGFEQKDPTADVTNMFRWKSVWDQSQVLLQKCLFQDGVFDPPFFKCFTIIIDLVVSHHIGYWDLIALTLL